MVMCVFCGRSGNCALYTIVQNVRVKKKSLNVSLELPKCRQFSDVLRELIPVSQCPGEEAVAVIHVMCGAQSSELVTLMCAGYPYFWLNVGWHWNGNCVVVITKENQMCFVTG